jgi:hypothetical protein
VRTALERDGLSGPASAPAQLVRAPQRLVYGVNAVGSHVSAVVGEAGAHARASTYSTVVPGPLMAKRAEPAALSTAEPLDKTIRMRTARSEESR